MTQENKNNQTNNPTNNPKPMHEDEDTKINKEMGTGRDSNQNNKRTQPDTNSDSRGYNADQKDQNNQNKHSNNEKNDGARKSDSTDKSYSAPSRDQR